MMEQQIVEGADELTAFRGGKSKGTKSSIDYAKKKGIEVRVAECAAE
jgi:hypothetical protein